MSHFQLEPDCALLEDSLVKLLYVEYRFLDYPMEELETPFSLPKKAPPEKIEFEFEKGIYKCQNYSLLITKTLSEVLKSDKLKFWKNIFHT